jgi:hypothetical protein
MTIQRGQRRKSNFSADNPVDAYAGVGISHRIIVMQDLGGFPGSAIGWAARGSCSPGSRPVLSFRNRKNA